MLHTIITAMMAVAMTTNIAVGSTTITTSEHCDFDYINEKVTVSTWTGADNIFSDGYYYTTTEVKEFTFDEYKEDHPWWN